MEIDILLTFFNSMNYRTYFLGKNHLIRVDNLCRSTLHNILKRPEFNVPPSPSVSSHDIKNNMYGFHTAPAFYVAIANSKRFKLETRAIQNTYDMLGVYSSLPSNAQDRSRERHSSYLSSLLRTVINSNSQDENLFSNRERIYTESE